jgi:hypothetical protein
MSKERRSVEELADREYKYGFVTDVESESLSPGLDEGTVRAISALKRDGLRPLVEAVARMLEGPGETDGTKVP